MQPSPIPIIDFDNTERSFAFLDNRSLKHQYWIFRLIANPLMVKTVNRLLVWGLEKKLPIEPLVKKTLYQVFVGGEGLKDCQNVIDKFKPFNVGVVPDYSIEAQETEEAMEEVTQATLESVDFCAKNRELAPFTVFKVTGLARFALLEKVHLHTALSDEEKKEWERVVERVERICKKCFENGISVFIDAEETWIQGALDDLAFMMMEKYNTSKAVVYNTYQMYRKDGLQRIKNGHLKAAAGNYILGAKLVRGAYMTKEALRAKELGYENPINPTKTSTDQLYDQGLQYCINEKQRIWLVAATHNELSSAFLVGLMAKHGLKPNDPQVYFSQLYGMSNNLSFNLSYAGYNVVKYLPYGPIRQTVPYLVRRAEENTSAMGQTPRELALIKKEMKRRRLL